MGQVSLTRVTVAHSLDTGKQMETQRCWAGKRPALWALNAHPTTASGPQNYCHPSGVHRGKQPHHRPMPRVTEKGVLFSAAPGLAVLLQGDLTLSSAVVRTERRHEGQKRLNHQLHKKPGAHAVNEGPSLAGDTFRGQVLCVNGTWHQLLQFPMCQGNRAVPCLVTMALLGHSSFTNC